MSSSILSSKTSSPGCATRRRRPRSSAGSPTGWRCSSWLKPPATCPCRTSRPDGGHGRVGGHGDRARRRAGGPPALDRGGARRGLHGGPGVPERPQVHPARPRRLRRPPVRHVARPIALRSEEHTSELQSPCNLVCRLLLEKKK